MRRFLFLAIVAITLCSCDDFTKTKAPPSPPPPPAGTAGELATGTETATRVWSPKILSDTYSGASAEVVDATVGVAGDTDTTHAYSKDDIHDYVAQHDSDYDGLPDGTEAGVVTATMLAATLDISGKTITFGLEASDIPDISATYQTLLTNSAGLAAALSDETGTGAAVLANGPTLIAPVLGTPASGDGSNITNVNAATAAATDSGDAAATWYPTIVDGATGAQAIQTDAGLSFNPNTNILTSAGGFSAGASATPTLRMKDSDATAGDDNYTIGANATDTGDGTEDIDITEQIQIAGTATTIRFVDADGHYQIGTTAMGLKLGTAGVLITNDGDGAITLLGQGDGSDEDLTLNFDDVSNEIGVTSSTGVDNINLGVIRVETTGDVTGGVLTTSKAAGYTLGTDDSRESYGGVVYVTSAATVTLPAIADGMSCSVITVGATAVSVDTNASDLMYLDGTALDDGDKATNTSTTGDTLVCTYYSADGWWCMSGSPDGDHWTDGGP